MVFEESTYRFGEFTFKAHEHSLRKGEQEIHLRPKAFETLLFLLEHHGRLITKDELLEAVWRDVIVTENTLSKSIEELRQALRDNPRLPKFIRTIPRVGFKFIADVEKVQPTPFAETISSLAVLPFVNLSGSADQNYFADGMTEALITGLARISGLRVISRTSVMVYREATKPLPEIARELNVDLVVEGSVQRSGDRVRITAQLIHASSDAHLWAETYERDIRDILALQRELAQAIASEIRMELIPSREDAADHRVDPAAYEAYLKGRYHWNKRTPEGLRKGVEYFEQAIHKDPNYALAYVGLADCYNMLNNYNVLSPQRAYAKAKAALTQAFQINSQFAEAHASLAFAKMFYEWDWMGAEQALRRAIEINPNYSAAHHWYGLYLAMQHRFDEALAKLQKALNLDPLSIIINTNVGWVLYFARRYDDAVKQLQQSLEFDSTFVSGRIKLGWVYEHLGKYDEAIAEFQTALGSGNDNPALQAILGHAYALANRKQAALDIAEGLTTSAQKEYVSSYLIALIHASLGDKQSAFDWLHKAFEDRDGWMAWIKVDPKLDALRDDSRFVELMKQVGFQ